MVTVRLLDVIGENTDDFFASLPVDKEDVHVELNSPGGDAHAGLAIFNKLNDLEGKVTIDVMGMAASAAALIFMAGDVRLIRENASIMIHNPFSFAGGDADDLRKRADNLEDLENQVAEIHANATGLKKDKILKMMAEETTLNADQAVKLGFATAKVKSSSKPKNYYKEMVFMGYKNIPIEYVPPEYKTNNDNIIKKWQEKIMLTAIMELLKVDKDTDIVSAIKKLQETPAIDLKTDNKAVLLLQTELATQKTTFEKAMAAMSENNTANTDFRKELKRKAAEDEIDLMISGGSKGEVFLTPAQKESWMAIYDSAVLMGNSTVFDKCIENIKAGGVNKTAMELIKSTGHGGGGGDGAIKGNPEDQFITKIEAIQEEKKIDYVSAEQWVRENEVGLTEKYETYILNVQHNNVQHN